MRTTRIMLHGFAMLTMLVMMGLSTSVANAQALPWEDRGFFNISGGVQVGSNDFTRDISFPIYDETGTFTESHPVGSGGLFDVSGGARVWENVGVGIGFSRFSDSADVTLPGSVPHPLFFNQLRGTSAQASGLSRTETAVHIQLMYMAVVTSELDVALSVGPSFFSVTQDVVSAVNVQEGGAPFDAVAGTTTTTTQVDDSAVGFNVGADVTYRFMPNIGAGLFLRYTGASVNLPSTSSDAGGFQVGIGLRVRF